MGKVILVLACCGNLTSWVSIRGEDRTDICPTLEIGTKRQKFLENVKSAV